MLTSETSLHLVTDHAALAAHAAALWAVAAHDAVATRGRFVVALSGGSTPRPIFETLAREPYASALPWRQTVVLWGDERLVPPEDPGSNYRQAHEALLRRVPVPAASILRAKGELAPDLAASDYRAALVNVAEPGRRWPRIDLALQGLGNDGHTASLFPGPISSTERRTPVMAVTADYEGRPASRITLTPLVLNDARLVVFALVGEAKAGTLAAVLRGPHQPEHLPAQRIAPPDGRVVWLFDRAAGRKL